MLLVKAARFQAI